MTRFAATRRVLFWEEPEYQVGADAATLRRHAAEGGVEVFTPMLSEADRGREDTVLATLLDAVVADTPGPLVRWYYTPMMLSFSDHVPADCIVYDCMDELSAFRDAPADLLAREQTLIERADVVFAGGASLYASKRDRHSNVHAFPSSIDAAHFGKARASTTQPADQADIPGPRLGFVGVIDERMDVGLLAAIADAQPNWSFVVVGPVVKIDEADLPRRANIHYLGSKSYAELPDYLAGWDVALMPFAMNEATRFISPTKTPEYLAAGCPVVSTPITDVVRQYGTLDAVGIADTADAFVAACDRAMTLRQQGTGWRDAADAQLATGSWNGTALAMDALIDKAIVLRDKHEAVVSPTSWPAAHERYDVMVVGAGFAGAVMAERLANDGGKRVLVVDRRPHIAGNAFDHLDAAGILIHQYGPHIFHTNSTEIVDYLSQFTDWRPYEHRVLAQVGAQQVPMPINRTTLNMLYDLDLHTDADVDAFLASRAEPVDPIRTSADVVVSKVGRELYETFFRGYTRKQWGMDPSELDKSVTARVPTRSDTDDRYFTDRFQAMPAAGYTAMFERMLDHPNIDVLLDVDYTAVRDVYPHDHLVFTGPIDEYFSHRYGALPYRSLRFEHRTEDTEWHQPVAVVNYPDEDVPYTRVTEYKHLTGQTALRTSLTTEYPSATGDPYYPIPRDENQALFKRYEALALAERNVSFVGRLATYRYYNMDQVVGQALATYRRLDAASERRAMAMNPAAAA
ncbi:UDP-galactopyranose mutase [Sphingomonas prati]|uniref:UDP-galactopyranose mutase n=1 Tax=Sphingomonas prati TaxID=1843237 RepID=A0A7W9BPZ0_9SPHN|nr:UDP-galactopyranose mutase [Sphingomonas prati]MBB5728017.1 UDP-galactopyranose mutase [Sphingomonas prati]GGE82630.1 UDP-galactopyranose mutase [Sphingomonas prati]